MAWTGTREILFSGCMKEVASPTGSPEVVKVQKQWRRNSQGNGKHRLRGDEYVR